MIAVGGREDPAARIEVALTYFHTACDTALVDSILFTVFLVPHDNISRKRLGRIGKGAKHQRSKVKVTVNTRKIKNLVLLSGQI